MKQALSSAPGQIALEAGQSFRTEHTISAEDAARCDAILAGRPRNTNRCDDEGAARLLVIGLVSQVLGREFPGPGTVVVSVEVCFERRVPLGEELQIEVRVADRSSRRGQVSMHVAARSPGGLLMTGEALLIPPPGEKK